METDAMFIKAERINEVRDLKAQDEMWSAK